MCWRELFNIQQSIQTTTTTISLKSLKKFPWINYNVRKLLRSGSITSSSRLFVVSCECWGGHREEMWILAAHKCCVLAGFAISRAFSLAREAPREPVDSQAHKRVCGRSYIIKSSNQLAAFFRDRTRATLNTVLWCVGVFFFFSNISNHISTLQHTTGTTFLFYFFGATPCPDIFACLFHSSTLFSLARSLLLLVCCGAASQHIPKKNSRAWILNEITRAESCCAEISPFGSFA